MAAPLDPECLFRVLSTHKVDYVLIGGLAAVLRGSTAMTNDADIMPAPDEANLSRLSHALGDLGARVRSDADPDGVAFEPHPALLASMATLNMTTRCGDLDLAFSPAGIESFEALQAASDTYELAGEKVAVAALADIIRSKEAAGRPKDHATLPILYALREEIERQD
ncbi:MAG: hypothetical protein HKN91_04710 [Acidimicrobiia bacterium]|nr:hypothetical protein [Acidimicrobiia bacterium]